MTDSTSIRGTGRAALLDAALMEMQEFGAGALSLRAIARRAGVSHAAPKYHFEDRSGLLTAVAIDGFIQLRDRLESAITGSSASPAESLTALGRAYLEFGLRSPELFKLMFRSDELDSTNESLLSAKSGAFEVLSRAVSDGAIAGAFTDRQPGETLTLISWAFIHGLVVLTHDGALATVAPDESPVELAAAFSSAISGRS